LGGEGIVGGSLKDTGTWEEGTGLWRSPNAGATNASGFTAQPGGHRNPTISNPQNSTRSRGYWWSSDNFEDRALVYYLSWIETYALYIVFEKSYGASVRCIKDTINKSP